MIYFTSSLTSFFNQVKKLTESQRNAITQVGFGQLLHFPSHTLRRTQLIELIETWNVERQAFIFPHGDITITLLDVALILGLHVIGRPVVLKEDTPLTTLEQEFGASKLKRFISVESLKKKLDSCNGRADSSFVQVFLLYCFGTLLFTNARGKVDSRYLLLLENLDEVSSFAWGSAVREDLHDSLTKTKTTSNMCGCLILLQIWWYEHIVIGRPNLLDCPSTFPRVCRWESSGRQYSRIKVQELDPTQILWRLQPTSEEIQIDIIKEIPQEWYLSGLGTIEEPINIESERVNRKVRVRIEEQKEEEEEEEEASRQRKSTIFVLSDDDESDSIKNLKEENIQLKATVEELKKDNEIMKNENEGLRMLVGKDKEVMKNEIEELRKLVENLRSDKRLIKNSVSNLERIVSECELDL